MNPILSALQSGPKSYDQLPALPNKDFILRVMLKRREVIFVGEEGCSKYAIPRPPPEDQKSTSKPQPKFPNGFCQRCGIPIPRRVYCSRECSSAARRANMKPCPVCGGPRLKHKLKYCSIKCKSKARKYIVPREGE